MQGPSVPPPQRDDPAAAAEHKLKGDAAYRAGLYEVKPCSTCCCLCDPVCSASADAFLQQSGRPHMDDRSPSRTTCICGPQSAVHAYSASLEGRTDDARVWANRAAAHLSAGNAAAALEDSRIARTVDPAYAKVRGAWQGSGRRLQCAGVHKERMQTLIARSPAASA
jgi:hypothetical protein